MGFGEKFACKYTARMSMCVRVCACVRHNNMDWVMNDVSSWPSANRFDLTIPSLLWITCGQRARLHKYYYLARIYSTWNESIGRHLKMLKPMFWHNFLRSQTAKEPATCLLSYNSWFCCCFCIFWTLSTPISITSTLRNFPGNGRGDHGRWEESAEKTRGFL